VDIAIVGAGAAGLAAAIFAGEAAAGKGLRIVLLEGAKKPGAKILVSGGGRCNVTNEMVTERDYWGGPRPIVRAVLRAFDHRRARQWMRSLGVALKLEPTGKYFPVSDNARTVLEALLRRVGEVGGELRAGTRVIGVERAAEGFTLPLAGGETLRARRLILATGGRSLPRSGSDGVGLTFAERLGHAIVPTTPALCPLVLRADAPDPAAARFAELAGVTLEARLELRDGAGRRLFAWTDSLVFTHFGLSGPGPMNLSRHLLRARLERPDETFTVTLGHPALPTPEAADRWLREQARAHPRRTIATALTELYPERLARLLAEGLGEGTATGAANAPSPLSQLRREERLALARRLAGLPLAVRRARGWACAETTAGGVDLREIDPRTLASRRAPGLYLCGEMLDVDGRIGGFNFQWAWASGYLAGRAAAASLLNSTSARDQRHGMGYTRDPTGQAGNIS
jgi:predicted Rossmann fold flavoprotein